MTQPEQRSGPLHPPVTRARPSTRCRARWVQPGCCLRITTQGCSIPIQESLIWIRPVSTRRFRCDTAQNNFKIIVFLGQKTSIILQASRQSSDISHFFMYYWNFKENTCQRCFQVPLDSISLPCSSPCTEGKRHMWALGISKALYYSSAKTRPFDFLISIYKHS